MLQGRESDTAFETDGSYCIMNGLGDMYRGTVAVWVHEVMQQRASAGLSVREYDVYAQPRVGDAIFVGAVMLSVQ